MVLSLMWEDSLGSNVDCYMEDSPRLLCTEITRGESSCNLDEGRISLFQCGFLHQDQFLTVLHRCYKRKKFNKRRFLEPFGERRKVVQRIQPQYLITSNLIIFWACGKMWLFQWSFMMKICPLLFEQMLQDNFFLLCQTFYVYIFNSLYLPHIDCLVKLLVTFKKAKTLYFWFLLT